MISFNHDRLSAGIPTWRNVLFYGGDAPAPALPNRIPGPAGAARRHYGGSGNSSVYARSDRPSTGPSALPVDLTAGGCGFFTTMAVDQIAVFAILPSGGWGGRFGQCLPAKKAGMRILAASILGTHRSRRTGISRHLRLYPLQPRQTPSRPLPSCVGILIVSSVRRYEALRGRLGMPLPARK